MKYPDGIQVSTFLLQQMKWNTDFKINFIDGALIKKCASRESDVALLFQVISLMKNFWVVNNGPASVQEQL